MDYNTLKQIIQDHAATAVFITITVAPVVAFVCSLHFKERISVLENQVEWLEKRLKDSTCVPATAPQILSPEPLSQSPSSAVTSQPVPRFPNIANPKSPTKAEIKELARFYGLFQEWPMNPHLRFLDGDISYWYEQGLSETRLKAEFEARRQVLERAESTGQRIPSQGDLSALATQIVTLILQK